MIKEYKKYKKSLTVKALQFDGKNWKPISDFCSNVYINSMIDPANGDLVLKLTNAELRMSKGSYIVSELSKEYFYILKKEVFESTHEPV